MNYEQVRAEKGMQKCRQRPFWVQRGSLIPGVLDSPWKTLQEVLSITPKDITTAAAVFTKTRGGVDAAQCPRDTQTAKAPPGRRARMESEIPSEPLLTAFIQVGWRVHLRTLLIFARGGNVKVRARYPSPSGNGRAT